MKNNTPDIEIVSLSPKALEVIERIVYKNTDDLYISIGRNFDRIEERIDAIEAKQYAKIEELKDLIAKISK